MNDMTIDRDQQIAAKVIGSIYLIAMATSMFSELYLRGPLMVAGDAAQTAANITASLSLFRLSTVIHLLTFATDAVLAIAFYVVLKKVNRNVALAGTAWRLVDCAILAVILLGDFAVMALLSGDSSLSAFNSQQLQALVRLCLNVEGAGFQIGFVFLGLGSTAFSILWLKSGYVPRVIAGWGIFASLVLAFGTVAILLFPALGVVGLSYMAPMFFYEVGLGLWLLIKGLRVPVSSGAGG